MKDMELTERRKARVQSYHDREFNNLDRFLIPCGKSALKPFSIGVGSSRPLENHFIGSRKKA